ncbi:flagellar synthesis regulator FleN [Desulfocucumis palustris]|uniref:Flagellar synthesis regulator FleN n=1 Tax=Desulfocucumis palustris TaxID=1898651 RepID=A0A2L2XG54_9FIRM|nr:flagellar synthesis regulator FleN [Desulfocucumis palustris]
MPEHYPPAGPGARVIAVTSGKGGVGKTSLVANLAIALAGMGQRVVVFDADLGLANVEVLLGVTPPRTLYDFLYGGRSLEDIITPGPMGVKLISGGAGFLELANLDNRLRQKLVDSLGKLDREADIVLVDTGAGISKNVLGFVAAAGEAIVVVIPEPTSFTDAYSMIKVLSTYRIHKEVKLVVNQAMDKTEALETFSRMDTVVNRYLTINLHNLGWVIKDNSVSQAVKEQRPLCMYNPRSGPARNITQLAHNLLSGYRHQEDGNIGTGGFIARLMRLFGQSGT